MVTKNTIVAALWADEAASDELLSRAVSLLRKALGPGGAGIIRTVYGEGFQARLPGEVRGPRRRAGPGGRQGADGHGL